MIRTNLSTRPFYNVRAVHAVIGTLAAIVLAISAFNVIEIVRLTRSQRTLGAQAQSAEQEAARLRAEATQILARVDPKELEAVSEAAGEANGLIDQRTFSWTDLFAHFEAALPDEVRITEVQQGSGSNELLIGAQARRIEDLDQFIEALETTGAFRNIIPISETSMENGLIEARLEATYTAAGQRADAR